MQHPGHRLHAQPHEGALAVVKLQCHKEDAVGRRGAVSAFCGFLDMLGDKLEVGKVLWHLYLRRGFALGVEEQDQGVVLGGGVRVAHEIFV